MNPLRSYLFVFLSASCAASAPAQQIDTLTLERAVTLAIEHQPSLHGSIAGVKAADAGLKLAVAGYLPSVALSASDTRTGGTILIPPHKPVLQQLCRRSHRDAHRLGFREDERQGVAEQLPFRRLTG